MSLLQGCVSLAVLLIIQAASAFQIATHYSQPRSHSLVNKSTAFFSQTSLTAKKDDGEGGVEEYKNAPTSILSNFMQSSEMKSDGGLPSEDPFGNIDFNTPKIAKKNIETLASMLDAELYEKEWFVTGQVNPSFFADDFEFQDPDVKLIGIEGVLLFGHCCSCCPCVTN